MNVFKDVPVNNLKRNYFDLSHEVKMSGKFGYLYPVLCLETLPGDSIDDTMTALVRFAPMISPMMHSVDVKTDFFFVPWRTVSDHWEPFITGGQDGEDAPILPYVSPGGIYAAFEDSRFRKGSLWDYFGLPVYSGVAPPGAYSQQQISALPFRAYTKIYNDYFRDPNLDDEIDLGLELAGDVSNTTQAIMSLKRRGWDRGYFTAALPFAQRGPSVLMPIGGAATIDYSYPAVVTDAAGNPVTGDRTLETLNASPGNLQAHNVAGGTWLPSGLQNIDSIDFENSTITINDFRRSLAIQAWLENSARGGGRYNESILSHWGVSVEDYRVQRAEYLGGGRQPVQISEVLATAESENVPVGDLAGRGISVGRTNRFNYFCREHGCIIGIMTVIPKPSYASQGVHRMWTRDNKYLHAWRELAHIGEQEITSKELFFSFDNADTVANNATFGYTPRFAEYKYMEDRVAGDFRDTLAHWHLARIFVVRPTLSASFLRMEENLTANEESYRRVFAVQDGTDYLWIQLFHSIGAKRALPYFGIPRMVG